MQKKFPNVGDRIQNPLTPTKRGNKCTGVKVEPLNSNRKQEDGERKSHYISTINKSARARVQINATKGAAKKHRLVIFAPTALTCVSNNARPNLVIGSQMSDVSLSLYLENKCCVLSGVKLSSTDDLHE